MQHTFYMCLCMCLYMYIFISLASIFYYKLIMDQWRV